MKRFSHHEKKRQSELSKPDRAETFQEAPGSFCFSTQEKVTGFVAIFEVKQYFFQQISIATHKSVSAFFFQPSARPGNKLECYFDFSCRFYPDACLFF
ncbi:hypothetical protein KCP77_10555 [Salmonella enterica subsp. enterica]|nr:hypothetical protein KCP77_10555 [Salmonella enterica subsp. enterica]